MIVDQSFFFGPLLIEGVSTGSGAGRTQEAVNGELRRFIDLYERRYLRGLLGRKLADEFVGYLESDTPDDVGARWQSLLEVLVPLPGVSPVANYVYFYYVRSNQRRATSLGVTETNSDNPIVPCDSLIVNAWNDMVGMNRDVVCFLRDHAADYPAVSTDYELLEPINVMGI